MKVNESDFIKISAGSYSIGISLECVEALSNALRDTPIKKEYLFASYPPHQFELDTVWIRKQLTRYEEFGSFVEETGYETEAEKDGWGWIWDNGWRKKNAVSWRCPFGSPEDERCRVARSLPAMQISWNDAAAYCAWMSARCGFEVRLPGEYEWEVFARIVGAPSIEKRLSENNMPATQGQYVTALEAGIQHQQLYEVSLLWEWTLDWYEQYPGGKAYKDFGTVYKVLRGGSLFSYPIQRTREFRLRKCPTARSPYYGFRIVTSFPHKHG